MYIPNEYLNGKTKIKNRVKYIIYLTFDISLKNQFVET